MKETIIGKSELIERLEVSDLYIQQVNTATLVLHLREAVDVALKNGMQYATAIGTLHMMIREVGDDAITQMELERVDCP